MKTVIFDVDGVLLSEKRYFDVSGLALWEWYNSPLFLGIGEEPVIAEPTEEKIEALRRHYWADDELLRRFKRHGINSNWDMVYLFAVCSFLVAAQGDANLFRGLSADFSTPPEQAFQKGRVHAGLAEIGHGIETAGFCHSVGPACTRPF